MFASPSRNSDERGEKKKKSFKKLEKQFPSFLSYTQTQIIELHLESLFCYTQTQ